MSRVKTVKANHHEIFAV